MSFRAVFFAAPSVFSASALHAWLGLGHEVTAFVHTARRATHEGALAWLAPRWSVGAALDAHRIPAHAIAAPGDLKQELPSADLAISVGFPFRIPMAYLRTLPRGGVNLHPALLPEFRGPAPISALWLEGAAGRCGGVTLHLLEHEFDTGPVLAQEPAPFRGDSIAWMLELARAHARLMAPLVRYLEGELMPTPQDESRASYFAARKPRLSEQQSADELAHLCATFGSQRKLNIQLAGRKVAVRGYRSRAPRSGRPPRIGPVTASFDAADARVVLARWLPGTRRFRRARWLLRLAFARSSLAVLALALTLACGPVPGGSLGGTVTPALPDWSAALEDGKAFCEIESRPEDPHSIQLECFVYEGALMVQSHRWAFASWWPTTSWAEIWLEHPDVRVRLGERIFELRAVRVTDEDLRKRILNLRGYDPPPEGIALFRFDPRV